MAKLKLKNKKKNLPKFTVGGYNSNNSIYATQVGDDKPFISSVSSSDPFGVQKDLNNSSLTKSSQPLMFAGQAPQSSGLNIDAGRFFNNTASDSQASASAGTSGASQSNKMNNVAGYAQMAGGAARAISAGSNRRDPEDFRSKQIAQEDAVMGAVGQIGPVGGVIAGAYNVGQSIGDPIRQSAEAENKQAAEKGKYELADKNEAASMAVVGGIFDPIKTIQARSSYSGGWTDLSGQGYAKHLEQKGQERLDELNRPKREAEMADMRNKLNYGTFRQGGINYPTNAIPMHGNQGAWAVPLFANGGETFQVDGPSHEQGGVVIPTPNGDYYEVEKKEVIKRLPNADEILSDEIINKRTGKTHAKDQAPYEELKEQVVKFKSDSAKKAIKEYASQKFDEHYNNQEMDKMLQKKLRLERDFFKCGGMVKYKDGGIHIKPENRGKFTAAANRAGMGVEEYANHILANKEDFSSTLVKRANFVDNAKDWNRNGGIEQYQGGGRRGKPTGYSEAVLVDPSKITPDYKFTQRTTEDLGGGRTKVTNLYNKPLTEKAIPSKMSSTTPPSPDWEKSIIDRLQSGVTTDDLVKQGFIGHEGAKKYAQYYKPLKTEITQEAPKQEARLYGEKTIAGKLLPGGYAGQPWETYRTFPEAGKANVYTDVHYHQGKPIDLNKSFDSAGNFKPVYLNNNATGTYLQQQGTEMHRNPLEVMPGSKTTNLMSSSVNRYGGIQKFDEGGKKNNNSYEPKYNYTTNDLAGNTNDEEWNAIANMAPGFEKDAMIDQYMKNATNRHLLKDSYIKSALPYSNKVEYSKSQLGVPQSQPSTQMVNPGVPMNPNNPYASTFNFNMPIGGPLDQAIMRDKNQSYASDGIPANAGPASSPNVSSNNQQETSPANKAEGQPGNYNQSGNRFNGDALYSGLGVLANSAGPLAYMIGEGKNYDRQQFYKYSPSELDFTPTKRAYDARRRAVLNNVKNLSGGHSGAALSNIAAQNADLNQSEDTAMREFANQMASIRNQAQQFNIQGQYSVDNINAINKGQALTNYYKSIGALGTNTASGMRDYRAGEMDQQQLNMMSDFFNNYYYDKASNSWKFRK